MSHYQAMQILDKVREGVPFPDHIITQALMLTGDIDWGLHLENNFIQPSETA